MTVGMAGTYVNPGEDYNRDQRYITTRITEDGRDMMRALGFAI